jgi:splicing factor 1
VLTGTGTADAENKRRRKRWGSEQDKVNIPTNPLIAAAAANLKPDEARALILRLRIDDLTKKIGNPMQAMADIPEHERSPSPEPVYDAQGKRLNTRPYRLREKLISQRHDCIIEAQKLIPDFRPPADYKPPKIHAKIFIPVDKYPDFGFMGLIIGPRGATHKKMERETNTKIAIRGKGTAKDNKLGRPQPGEDEPMHVYVQGERQDDVDRAARMIRELLRPDDAKIEEHKQEQLKQLALLNGTWREEIRCRVCNEPGHRIFDCPQRSGSWVAANVVCEICGESTHITKDCRKLLNKDFAVEKQKMITEYDAFMAELTSDRGSVGGASGPTLALTGPDGTALPAADGNRAVPAPLSSGAPAAAPPPYLAGTAIPPYLRNQQRMQQQQQQQQQVQQYQQLQQQQMQQQWGYGAPAWGAYAAPTPPPHCTTLSVLLSFLDHFFILILFTDPSAAPPMPPQWPPCANPIITFSKVFILYNCADFLKIQTRMVPLLVPRRRRLHLHHRRNSSRVCLG